MSINKDQHATPNKVTSETAHISTRIKVHITAINSELESEHPIYAINWFNTRSLWLYNIYNLFAARSVLKVKGLPFFKARVKRRLYGKQEDHRDVLLIVRYPQISSFKVMLENRYFQCVSVLRGLAVNFFTFGFSTRNDISDEEMIHDKKQDTWHISKTNAYAFHHYKLHENSLDSNNLHKNIDKKDRNDPNEAPSNNTQQKVQAKDEAPFELSHTKIAENIKRLAAMHHVNLAFSSHISARLYPQKNDHIPKPVDTIMSACLILQADTEKSIESLVQSEEYQQFINATKSSFIASLDRVL